MSSPSRFALLSVYVLAVAVRFFFINFLLHAEEREDNSRERETHTHRGDDVADRQRMISMAVIVDGGD